MTEYHCAKFQVQSSILPEFRKGGNFFRSCVALPPPHTPRVTQDQKSPGKLVLNKQSSKNKSISNTENFIKAINSGNNITKYFTIKDLNYTFSDIGSPFSFFHLNINSLSFHFDKLESLISKSKYGFQIISMTETRFKKTQETSTNIQLENFNIKHVPTESANRGVLLHIRKAINCKLRPDLMIYEKRELELFLLK